MQFLRSLLESVVVIVAHVEVDLHALEFSRGSVLGDIKDAIALQVGEIDGVTEDIAQHGSRRAGASRSEVRWNIGKQCRHLGADRRALLGILEGKPQRTEAAHGDARDAAPSAHWLDAILLLHLRYEFFRQKILVANLAIRRVDEKSVTAAGSQHHKFADLAL